MQSICSVIISFMFITLFFKLWFITIPTCIVIYFIIKPKKYTIEQKILIARLKEVNEYRNTHNGRITPKMKAEGYWTFHS